MHTSKNQIPLLLGVVCAAVVAATGSSCELAFDEKTFNTIIYGLFTENHIPDGDILDCGAHIGDFTCMYACFDPKRTVRALEPFKSSFDSISCPSNKNVIKYNLGLSKVPGFLVDKPNGFEFDAKTINKIRATPTNGAFEFDSIDNFFSARTKSYPGFLHLDVEGYELNVLEGG